MWHLATELCLHSATVVKHALHHIRPSPGPWLVSAGMVVMGIGIHLAGAEWNTRRRRARPTTPPEQRRAGRYQRTGRAS